MTADTIEIRGRFAGGCVPADNVRLAFVNEDESKWKDIAVNAAGEFRLRHYLAEPRRVALRTMKGTTFSFFATTKEKTYALEITCAGNAETIELKNSDEYKAYQPFTDASRKFQNELDSLGKSDIATKEVFSAVKKSFAEYHKTISAIAAEHPATFTAQVLCAAEKLPANALSSPDTLRKVFLRREAFANPHFYNDFLAQRILYNYMALRDKQSTTDAPVEELLSFVAKNAEASKRLQEMLYTIFYKSYKEENLVKTYAGWAKRNPELMYNESAKARLQRLSKVIAGSNILDFELKDPNGIAQKLSASVAASKLTILIFYSPTCGHCRELLPELRPLWETFHAKGLNIFAVAKDAQPDEWKEFIPKYASPEWVHVIEDETVPQPSDRYYADYTPKFFLIDAQGKIISGMASMDYLKEEIPVRLK